jgi:hypothetical protein
MKTITINNHPLSLALGPIERDHDSGAAWRSGTATPEGGSPIPCGGGWIESKDSADQANEEVGIAGGLRQGVSYPNEVQPGDYRPYSLGEDESGWEDDIMPLLYGPEWKSHEDVREHLAATYAAIQNALEKLA